MYIQRNQEYEKAKESLFKAESVEGIDGSKIDKKKKIEDEASSKVFKTSLRIELEISVSPEIASIVEFLYLKVQEAEWNYKACVDIANDRHQSLENTKVCELLVYSRHTRQFRGCSCTEPLV